MVRTIDGPRPAPHRAEAALLSPGTATLSPSTERTALQSAACVLEIVLIYGVRDARPSVVAPLAATAPGDGCAGSCSRGAPSVRVTPSRVERRLAGDLEHLEPWLKLNITGFMPRRCGR